MDNTLLSTVRLWCSLLELLCPFFLYPSQNTFFRVQFLPPPCPVLVYHFNVQIVADISIHVPLVGNDFMATPRLSIMVFQSTSPSRGTTQPCLEKKLHELFQSTSPSRGTTIASYWIDTTLQISIHVPLARNDNISKHFNTHF